MVDLTDVYAALQKADAAGDTEGAKKLADYIRSQTATPTEAAPAPAEGMPAERTPSFLQRTMTKMQGEGPSVEGAAEKIAAMGRGAIKGTLGTPGDIAALVNLGAAKLGLAPEGLTEPYIPTSEQVGEMFGLGTTPPQYAGYELAGNFIGPGLATRGINAASRGVNAARCLVEQYAGLPYNKMLEALGPDAPAVLNALRASKTGAETGGQAAAGVGNVEFSRFAKGYEEKLPQTYADIADRQKALIEQQAQRVESTATTEQKAIADQVASPDTQEVGKKLTAIADKEKETVRAKVIRPAFRKAENLAGDAGVDIGNVTAEAASIANTIDPDAAAIISRRLGKFQSETTTPEHFVSLGEGGGYSVAGKPEVKPPTATLSEIGDIRSAINDAAAAAKAKYDEKGFERLMALHKELDTAVTTSDALSPEAIAAYKDALDTYKTQFAPRFKTGLQVNLFKIRNGQNAITPTNVIDRFLNNADTTDNFVALFGKNPTAMAEAQKGVEGLFRDQVIKDGVIDPNRYAKFIKDYGPQIDKLDAAGLNVRSKLDDLVAKTADINAPKETAIALQSKGSALPEGPKATQIAGEVNDVIKSLKPDDVDFIAQIAARSRRFAEMSTPRTQPETGGIKYRPLALAKRGVAELYDELSQRLGNKTAKRISELLSTPEGTQAFIETAQKSVARQAARKTAAERAAQSRNALGLQLGVLGSVSNALAQ
jgi:hypothetical protein